MYQNVYIYILHSVDYYMLASQYTKKTHTHARRSAPKKSSKYRSRKKQNQKQCSGAATKNRKPNENFIFLDLSSFMIVHFRWCHWLCCVVLLFWICMPPVLVRRRSKEGFFLFVFSWANVNGTQAGEMFERYRYTGRSTVEQWIDLKHIE